MQHVGAGFRGLTAKHWHLPWLPRLSNLKCLNLELDLDLEDYEPPRHQRPQADSWSTFDLSHLTACRPWLSAKAWEKEMAALQ